MNIIETNGKGTDNAKVVAFAQIARSERLVWCEEVNNKFRVFVTGEVLAYEFDSKADAAVQFMLLCSLERARNSCS